MPDWLTRSGLIAGMLLLVMTTAQAQQPQQDLDSVRQQKAFEEDKANRLEKQATALRKELEQQSVSLAELAAEIRRGEAELSGLDDARAHAEGRIASIELDLRDSREQVAKALSALAGVSGTPPLAVIARPGSVHDSRLEAAALAGLTPALEAQMARLRQSLADLELQKIELAALKLRGADTLAGIRASRDQLQDLIERKRERARTSAAQADKARQNVQALAQEVKTLTALMRRLDELQPVTAPAVARAPTSFTALKGRVPLPAEYAPGGAPTFKNNEVRLQTRGGAIVTAPHDAIVRFAGPFRSYEGLLILDFGDGYHLLVAGLSGIDVVVGQWLLAGEPVGRMPGGLTGAPAELYLELRRDGSVIDPAPWLTKRQGRSSG